MGLNPSIFWKGVETQNPSVETHFDGVETHFASVETHFCGVETHFVQALRRKVNRCLYNFASDSKCVDFLC